MKKILIFLILCLFLTLSGCTNCNNSLPIENFKELLEKESVLQNENKYTTEYSIGYNGKLYDSLFMFSTPISNIIRPQNKQPEISYQKYPKCSDEEIKMSNINYKTSIKFDNLFYKKVLDKNGKAVYTDDKDNQELNISKTTCGYHFEIKGNIDNFYKIAIKIENTETEDQINYINQKNILFKNLKDEKVIILQPFSIKVNDKDEPISLDYELEHFSKNEYCFIIHTEKFKGQNAEIFFNIDYYYDKFILDTEVSQNKRNSYMSDIAYVGESNNNCSRLLARINLKTLYKYNERIDEVHLRFKIINTETKNDLLLSFCKEDWCSWTVDWESAPDINSDEIIGKYVDGGYIQFDITEYVKKCLVDKNSLRERYGMLIKSRGEVNVKTAIATSDNSFLPPYLFIKLNNERG